MPRNTNFSNIEFYKFTLKNLFYEETKDVSKLSETKSCGYQVGTFCKKNCVISFDLLQFCDFSFEEG